MSLTISPAGIHTPPETQIIDANPKLAINAETYESYVKERVEIIQEDGNALLEKVKTHIEGLKSAILDTASTDSISSAQTKALNTLISGAEALLKEGNAFMPQLTDYATKPQNAIYKTAQLLGLTGLLNKELSLLGTYINSAKALLKQQPPAIPSSLIKLE